MPKSRAPSPEFQEPMIELVRKAGSVEELARQFEPSAQAIRNRARQADRDAGTRQDGPRRRSRRSCGAGGGRIARCAKNAKWQESRGLVRAWLG